MSNKKITFHIPARTNSPEVQPATWASLNVDHSFLEKLTDAQAMVKKHGLAEVSFPYMPDRWGATSCMSKSVLCREPRLTICQEHFWFSDRVDESRGLSTDAIQLSELASKFSSSKDGATVYLGEFPQSLRALVDSTPPEHPNAADLIGPLTTSQKVYLLNCLSYTVLSTSAGNMTGWYALLPGEENFFETENGKKNYIGFFPTEDELLREACESVLSSWVADLESGDFQKFIADGMSVTLRHEKGRYHIFRNGNLHINSAKSLLQAIIFGEKTGLDMLRERNSETYPETDRPRQ